MKFESITMENFMRYKGRNHIEFSCDDVKNVTVVLGLSLIHISEPTRRS